MFSVKPPERIPASLTITGQGREQTLKLVYRHTPRKEYGALLEAIGKEEITPEAGVLKLVESWEADAELSAPVLSQLEEDQPGAIWAILSGYSQALAVGREKN